jgi:hypothetical protein
MYSVFGLAFYCLAPAITAGLVYGEHRLLRRVKADPQLDRSTRRLMFIAIYLGPLALYLLVASAISAAYLTGTYSWLGETQSIGLLEQFGFNMLIVVMVSWPLLGMYTLLGGMISLLTWREEAEPGTAALDTGSY